MYFFKINFIYGANACMQFSSRNHIFFTLFDYAVWEE